MNKNAGFIGLIPLIVIVFILGAGGYYASTKIAKEEPDKKQWVIEETKSESPSVVVEDTQKKTTVDTKASVALNNYDIKAIVQPAQKMSVKSGDTLQYNIAAGKSVESLSLNLGLVDNKTITRKSNNDNFIFTYKIPEKLSIEGLAEILIIPEYSEAGSMPLSIPKISTKIYISSNRTPIDLVFLSDEKDVLTVSMSDPQLKDGVPMVGFAKYFNCLSFLAKLPELGGAHSIQIFHLNALL